MWKWVDKPEYVTSILTLLYCHRIYSVFSYLETINDIIWDGSLVIRPTGHNQSQVSTSLKKENQICTPERNNLYWKGNGSIQLCNSKKNPQKTKKKTRQYVWVWVLRLLDWEGRWNRTLDRLRISWIRIWYFRKDYRNWPL